MRQFIVCVAVCIMAVVLIGNPASAKNTPNRLEITSATVVWGDAENLPALSGSMASTLETTPGSGWMTANRPLR